MLMETYQVVIREYLEKKVEIEAETPSLAVCAVEDKYNNAQIVLSTDDHSGTDIALSVGDKLCEEYLKNTLFRTFVDDKFKQMTPEFEPEEKMRLAFGSPDNAIFEFENRLGADKAVYEINSEVEKVNLDTPFYNKVFISGKIQLTRRELEELPCPLCTKNVGDSVMQDIVQDAECEVNKWDYDDDNAELEFKFEDIRLREIEDAAVRHKIPYYDDLHP